MKELVKIFKALADETRLRILNLLLKQELCVCDLMEILDTYQPKVSRHLAYLKNAGLLEDRRQGAWIIYSIKKQDDMTLHRLIDFLRENFHLNETLQRDVAQLDRLISLGMCHRVLK